VPIAVDDAITIELPSMTLGSLATPATGGCGTTTFIASATGTTLTLTPKTDNLAANTACAITIATGVTTAAAAQAQDLSSRTAAVTLAGGNNIGATTIIKSPAVPVALFTGSSLKIGTGTNAPIATEQPVAFTFTTQVPLAINDVIAIALPDFTLGTIVIGSYSAGCGTTTFTGAGSGSGAGVILSLTVKVATLSQASSCTVTIDTGVTSPATSTVANLNTRTVAATIAAATNVVAAPIPISTFVGLKGAYDTSLVIDNPYAGTLTTLQFGFKTNAAIAVGDSIALVLPDWGFTVTLIPDTDMGPLLTVGCGTTTFMGVTSNGGQGTASITLTAATATLAVDTSCNIKIGTRWNTGRVQVADAAQAANLVDRTFSTTISSAASSAQAITLSTATTVPTLVTGMVIATPMAGASTQVEFSFQTTVPCKEKLPHNHSALTSNP